MDFGQNIKLLREKKHLTQTDIAEELFVSRKTVSSWENERSYPDMVTLVKLSDIYQISLDKLLKEDLSMLDHYQKQSVTSDNDIKMARISYYANCGLLFFTYLAYLLQWKPVTMIFLFILIINLTVLVSHYQGYRNWFNNRRQLGKLILAILMILIINTLILHLPLIAPAGDTVLEANAYKLGSIVAQILKIVGITCSFIFIFFGKPAKNK